MKLASLHTPLILALAVPVLLLAACDGGGGGGGGGSDGGDTSDAGSCTPAAEVKCTQHFQCKARAVCAADRGSTICNLSDRGGDGTCTFETLSIPGSGDFEVPDLGCYATAKAPPGPSMVRLRGCVEVFGLDLDTSGGLTLEFYVQADGLGSTPVATATSDVASTVLGTSCPNTGAFDVGTETVPTNTALIVKVTDLTGEFVDTYKFGMVLGADKATDVGGMQTVNEPATVIAVSTYQVFPQTAGISAGIDGAGDLLDGVGRGALAGTISACNRREMANVGVTIDNMDADRIVDSEGGVEGRLAFTDGNENPDVRRGTTNIDGVFAAINIKPGDRTLVLSTTSNGTTTELITYTVPVFADSVTLFSPQGAMP